MNMRDKLAVVVSDRSSLLGLWLLLPVEEAARGLSWLAKQNVHVDVEEGSSVADGDHERMLLVHFEHLAELDIVESREEGVRNDDAVGAAESGVCVGLGSQKHSPGLRQVFIRKLDIVEPECKL